MEERTTSLRLSGPAKIDGKWRMPGERVTVSDNMLVDLIAGYAVDGRSVQSIGTDVLTSADFDKAVAAEVAERDAHWSTAFDHFETLWDDQKLEALLAEGQHRADLENLDAELVAAKARIAALETEVATAEARAVAAEKATAKPVKEARS